MVQPFAIRLLYAALAAEVHVDLAALSPPFIPNIMFDCPFVSQETNMFSMDCAVREHFKNEYWSAF